MYDRYDPSEYFWHLDRLRESGKINMFGAPRWLRDNFGLSKEEARYVFLEWTKTYMARSSSG